MDATGIASVMGAAAFGGAALRYGWRQVDAGRQERSAARQRAAWAGHATCLPLRSAGECVGLPTGRAAVDSGTPRPGPGLVGPVVVEPATADAVPDYVPDVIVGQVLRDLLHERDRP